jgi:hypothetical protein
MKLLDAALFEAKKHLSNQTDDDMFYNFEFGGQQFDLNVYVKEDINYIWCADLYCVFDGKIDTSVRMIISEDLQFV